MLRLFLEESVKSRSAKVVRALALVAVALILAGSARLQAQEAGTAKVRLAFEIATVREVNMHKIDVIDMHVYPGGHLVIRAHRLAMLIAEAFNISEPQIVGGDEEVVQAWFDVEGKAPEEMRASLPGSESAEAGIRDERVRLMLQTLLIERFHLKFHVEHRPGTVYEIRRGDGPLRLLPVEVKAAAPADEKKVLAERADTTGVMIGASGQHLEFRQTTMPQLAHWLAFYRRTPVTDQTGLTGFYNFKSKIVLSDEDMSLSGMARIFEETFPEMGLKFVKTDGLVEKFVIDSVQSPTEN